MRRQTRHRCCLAGMIGTLVAIWYFYAMMHDGEHHFAYLEDGYTAYAMAEGPVDSDRWAAIKGGVVKTPKISDEDGSETLRKYNYKLEFREPQEEQRHGVEKMELEPHHMEDKIRTIDEEEDRVDVDQWSQPKKHTKSKSKTKHKRVHPKVDDDDQTTVAVTLSTTDVMSTTELSVTQKPPKTGHEHSHHDQGHTHLHAHTRKVPHEDHDRKEQHLEQEIVEQAIEEQPIIQPVEEQPIVSPVEEQIESLMEPEESEPEPEPEPIPEPEPQPPVEDQQLAESQQPIGAQSIVLQPQGTQPPPMQPVAIQTSMEVHEPLGIESMAVHTMEMKAEAELTEVQPPPEEVVPEQTIEEEETHPHGHGHHKSHHPHHEHGHHDSTHSHHHHKSEQVEWTPEDLLASNTTDEDLVSNRTTKLSLNETMPTNVELQAMMMQQLPDAPTRKSDRVNWEKFFSFIPNGLVSCLDLFPNLDNENPLPQDFQQSYIEYVETIKQLNTTDDNIAQHLEQFIVYYFLVRAPFVETVCETGFGSGHSSFLWLLANPDVKVYAFDLGLRDYSAPIAGYLAARFPGRLNVIWGDSVNTLPVFRQNNKDVTCDIVIIDGGHTFRETFADYFHFRQMVTKNNIVLLDNYPDITKDYMNVLGSVWEGGKRRGEINEIFHCDYRPHPHGFSVGRYTPYGMSPQELDNVRIPVQTQPVPPLM